MNRKVLYGYQIKDGKLMPHSQEAAVVHRIFALCLEGKFQWEISDTLNAQGILYSSDRPVWTKFRISFILRNQRYIGADGYPVLIDSEIFQNVQALLQKKWGKRTRQDRPVSALREKMRCTCAGRLKRWFSSVHRADTLYLRCTQCGTEVTIPDADLLAEVERQAAEYTLPADSASYVPSEDTVRLTNAINRGLEHPEHPEDVVALILQGISARYTLAQDSEFLITLFSGFAQAESESISKATSWGVQKSREAGKVPFQYQKLLGYQRGPDGQPEIIPEEAETVKRIFRRYLDGCSLGQIRAELEADKIPTSSGVQGWTYQVIHNILINEKYIGDALLQKTYTTDCISKTVKKNQGERPNAIKLSPGQAGVGPKKETPARFQNRAGVSFSATTRRTAEKGHPRPPQTRLAGIF